MRFFILMVLMLCTLPAMAQQVQIYVRTQGEAWGQPVAVVDYSTESKTFEGQTTLGTLCSDEEADCVPTTERFRLSGKVTPQAEGLASLHVRLVEQNIQFNANIPMFDGVAMDVKNFEPSKTVEMRIQTVAVMVPSS